MRQTVLQPRAYCVAAALSLLAIPDAVPAADYYLANKPGSGSGTKDDPFGLADLPEPDNKPTRPLTILQPGDTLWFKGGEYAFHTGPVKEFYYKGYLRPVQSGESGRPISFRACLGEKHLAYMDYNVYTAPPKYTFGAYSQGRGQTFGMDEMRSRGFEQHSQVVAGAGEVFKDERSWELLPKWKTAGRDRDAVGPENVALVLDPTRYGPAGRTATAPAADVKIHRDLAYAKPENPQQTLDVYAPADGQRLPVVVWMFAFMDAVLKSGRRWLP